MADQVERAGYEAGDLVERLRNAPLIEAQGMIGAAPAEIERLRAEVSDLRRARNAALELLRHLYERWLDADDYAPEFRERFVEVLNCIESELGKGA